MFFTGEYELTVDAKSRLSIPYAIRDKLNAQDDGRSFYVLPGRRAGTLAIYPERYYEKLRLRALPDGDYPESVHEWCQFELSQTYLVDPDTQGRILVPDRLLKRAGIAKEVTLIGVLDHMELWPRQAFDEFVTQKWPEYPSQRRASEAEFAKREAERSRRAADATKPNSPSE